MDIEHGPKNPNSTTRFLQCRKPVHAIASSKTRLRWHRPQSLAHGRNADVAPLHSTQPAPAPRISQAIRYLDAELWVCTARQQQHQQLKSQQPWLQPHTLRTSLMAAEPDGTGTRWHPGHRLYLKKEPQWLLHLGSKMATGVGWNS